MLSVAVYVHDLNGTTRHFKSVSTFEASIHSQSTVLKPLEKLEEKEQEDKAREAVP